MIRLSAFADEISQNPVEQVDVLSRHGIKFIEFRAIHGTNVLDLSQSQHAEYRNLLQSRGFGLSAIGSPIGKVMITEKFDEHLARFDIAMQLADYYEAPRIRIFSFYMPPGDDQAIHREAVLARMTELTRRAADRGITLILENEKGIFGDTAARVADVLDSVSSPFLIHAFDPANYLEVGQSIDEAWSLLRPHVKHFHVKDYDTKSHRNVPAGLGDGQIPGCSGKQPHGATTDSARSSRTLSSRRNRSALQAPTASPTRRMPSRRFCGRPRFRSIELSRCCAGRTARAAASIWDNATCERVGVAAGPSLPDGIGYPQGSNRRFHI